MKRLVLGVVLGSLAWVGPAVCGEIKETTTYFMVKGSTFAELDRALGLKGPLLASGERRAGATEVAFKGDLSYKLKGDGCRVDKARFRLDLHTTLPRWSAPSSAGPETKALWRTLHQDIVTHEAKHASIAKSWLKRLETEVGTLPAEPTCARMGIKANAATRALLLGHETAQRRFDAAEAKVIDARLARELAAKGHRIATR